MPPALVLTAGLGTRLRPLTLVRAKPAVPIAGVPLVRRIVAWLAASGVVELVLNLHHRPETIAAAVGDGSDLGARVRYSWEQPVVLGTAGGPRQALSILGAGTFLIVNGDTLTDASVPALVEAHERSGALVTLAVVPNREPDKYGGVVLDAAGCATGFVPAGASAAGSFHFVGLQAAQAAAFDAVPAGSPASSVGGAYDQLIARQPGAVRGFVTDASFWDVGTIADYWRTSAAFGGPIHGANVRVAPSASVGRSILWDDVEVGAGAVLEDCIVTDTVSVPAHARYRRAALVGTGGQFTATAFE